jgi:UDP-2,4-diacetamido-2,4,6-trideoxy-beta-L-altropyranose hydrolase
MKAVIRADASTLIGNGHVMRCLTLAKALLEIGVETTFICRPLPGDLITYIQSKGVAVFVLPELTAEQFDACFDSEKTIPHWQQDAEECLALLADHQTHWLIIDHYGLDASWHQTMRPVCHQVLVMDDLANRPLDTDALIDQNPGRQSADYDAYVPIEAPRYIGPAYAILKPDFAALRTRSLSRRLGAKGMHILVSLGGVDNQNVTDSVLQALENAALPQDTRITVVLGLHAPWRSSVARTVACMSYTTQLITHTEHMAELMCDADLAIGAAGTTALERCCMGLPSIQLVLADNQVTAAVALSQAGAAMTIPLQNDLKEAIQNALSHLLADDNLTQMQLAAAVMVDGRGTQRVLNEVMHVE